MHACVFTVLLFGCPLKCVKRRKRSGINATGSLVYTWVSSKEIVTQKEFYARTERLF